MAWTSNPIMSWRSAAGTVIKVTDHGRSPLSENIERIENRQRMADGTLRRYTVAKKRSWSCSWKNIPSDNDVAGGMKTVDGGMAGDDIENWVRDTDGIFRMILRRGSAVDMVAPNPAEGLIPYNDGNFYIVNVMVTEFDKEVTKRGRVDLWDLSITLEEV